MGIINVTSDRKNVTLDSDVILYILMNGKIAEIHIVGGRVYQTRIALKDLEGLLYTVRKKKQIVAEIQEKQKNMINALEKKGIPATEEEYCRHYSSFEYLPIAFTDIEMVFDEENVRHYMEKYWKSWTIARK